MSMESTKNEENLNSENLTVKNLVKFLETDMNENENCIPRIC